VGESRRLFIDGEPIQAVVPALSSTSRCDGGALERFRQDGQSNRRPICRMIGVTLRVPGSSRS